MSSVSFMSQLGGQISKDTSVDSPRSLTRYMGGWQRQNTPYISGYWQFLVQPPQTLFQTHGNVPLNYAQKWFLSTAESFQPPTRSLHMVDVHGQGGVGASFPARQEIGRQINIGFREYSKLPIIKLISLWTSIFDPYVGVSEFSSSEWIPKSYKGIGYVILTKPVGAGTTSITPDDIEEVFLFDGLVPTTLPIDTLNQDIANNESLTLQTQWTFDGYPLTSAQDQVLTNAVSLLNSVAANGYNDTWQNMISSLNVNGGAPTSLFGT